MPWSLTPRHRARTAPAARTNLRPARRPSSSSSTVQYRTPDGSLTGNARIARSPDLALCLSDYYQPQAPHPGRHAAEPGHMPGSRNVTRQLEDGGRPNPVQRLDCPLLAHMAAQVSGAGPVRGRAAHAGRGDRREGVAGQVAHVAFDQQDLADVRERQVLGGGHDLDGAGGDPAVAPVGGLMRDRDLVPGQRVEGVEQGLTVLLDR